MDKSMRRCVAYLVIFAQGFLCWADQSERYAIVFDVGNVLIKEPGSDWRGNLSIFSLIAQDTGGFLKAAFSARGLSDKFYDVLNNVGLHVTFPVPMYSRGKLMHHGLAVKMTDIMTPQEIIDEANAVIDLWLAEDRCRPCPYHEKLLKHFSTPHQAELVRSLIYTTVDPERFVSLISPYEAGLELLERCASEKNEYGAPRHELFLLSNFDASSWNLLIKNDRIEQGTASVPHRCEICSESGSCGTHRLISGMFKSENHVKPNLVFYHVLLHQCAQHGIMPDHVIFCDDNVQNIEAAGRLGICAYHVADAKSFTAIAHDLEAKGILSS
jgi:FMN phosphatase YigB (HAD superfamily)